MTELAKKIQEAANNENFSSKDAETIRQALESVSNCFSYSGKRTVNDLYEELDDKKSRYFLKELAKAWILYWVTSEYRWIDDRNRISTDKCWKIKETKAFLQEACENTVDKRCICIMKEIGVQTHRTLVQSLSSLFFLILEKEYPEIGVEMAHIYGEHWYRSPMI